MRPFAPLLALVLLGVPAAASAAGASVFLSGRSVLDASSTPGNAYLAGAAVTVTAPTAGDLSVLAGTATVADSVKGDALLLGGSVHMQATVAGDVRAAGGTVTLDGPIGGDLVALGYRVDDTASAAGSVFVVAENATLSDGARGPVTVYANNVVLGGTFAGNVRVVASGRVSLAPGTVIRGTLSYDAPESASIPDSAVIEGGVSYTNAAYLPSKEASRALAAASLGIFLLARVLGALMLAGLIAGLFPRLAETLAVRARRGKTRGTLLTLLLGFAALVAAPFLLLLIALTFIGLGIALVGLLGYALLAALSYVYAGILLGVFIAWRFERRTTVLWRDGVLGMLALSLVGLVPFVGALALILLMTFSAGALLAAFFEFAFPHDTRA